MKAEDLINEIGEHNVQLLIDKFKGTKLWIPSPLARTSTAHLRLVNLIGLDATLKLCELIGDDHWHVPSSLRNPCRQQVAQLHREGKTVNEIAQFVGRSRRTIFRLLNEKITRRTI